jgi:hypothetical protein
MPRRGVFLFLALPVLAIAGMLVWYFLWRMPADGAPVDPAVTNRIRLAGGAMVVGAMAAWLALRGRS